MHSHQASTCSVAAATAYCIIWHIRSGNLSKFPLSCRLRAGHPRAPGPKNGAHLFPDFLLLAQGCQAWEPPRGGERGIVGFYRCLKPSVEPGLWE